MSSELERLHQEIRTCIRCVTAGYLPEATPIVRGRVDQRLMIVGQAPGINAARTQVPWSGASGVILRGWLQRIGIEPETWLETCYLTSTTKCFPGKPPSGSGDRAPSRREQALCRSFLDREIALIQPSVIVTLGRIAAESLLPQLRPQSLTAFVGQVFRADFGFGEVPVVPLPHPSGVSRWLNDPENRALVDHGLERLIDLYTASARKDGPAP